MSWKEELTFIAQQLIDSDHWWETDTGEEILRIIRNIPENPAGFEVIDKKTGEEVDRIWLRKFAIENHWEDELWPCEELLPLLDKKGDLYLMDGGSGFLAWIPGEKWKDRIEVRLK